MNLPIDCKSVQEIAKAVQETEKTASRALDLTEKGALFLSTVVGPATEALGSAVGVLSDHAAYYRAINHNRLAVKYWDDVHRRGLSLDQIRHLPFGEAYRALEAASLEDDEDVQALWAKLFLNATAKRLAVTIKRVYINLLRSISSLEVHILNDLWYIGKQNAPIYLVDARIKREFDERVRSYCAQFEENDRVISVQNLIRLRLVIYTPREPHVFTPSGGHDRQSRALVQAFGQVEKVLSYLTQMRLADAGLFDGITSLEPDLIGGRYQLTALGKDLMNTCSEPDSIDQETASDASSTPIAP